MQDKTEVIADHYKYRVRTGVEVEFDFAWTFLQAKATWFHFQTRSEIKFIAVHHYIIT